MAALRDQFILENINSNLFQVTSDQKLLADSDYMKCVNWVGISVHFLLDKCPQYKVTIPKGNGCSSPDSLIGGVKI